MTTDPTPAPARARDRNTDGRPENARPRDRFGAPLPRDAVDEMPDRLDPEDVCVAPSDALAHIRRLWDAERFFETHEFVEFIWKHDDTPDDERIFWKGLAQAAVGFCHVQRGNPVGARTLLERGAKHMGQAPDVALAPGPALIAVTQAGAAQLGHGVALEGVVFPPYPTD